MLCRDFFTVTNMSFNAIRENKILAKISGFTIPGAFGSLHVSLIFTNMINDLLPSYKDL